MAQGSACWILSRYSRMLVDLQVYNYTSCVVVDDNQEFIVNLHPVLPVNQRPIDVLDV